MKKQSWLKRKYYYICSKIRAMAKYLKDLLEHATSQGYKSNVIKPLSGMMIIFVIGAIASHYFDVPYLPFLLALLATICGTGMLIAYFFCLFRNPDLLRSERYNLEKTAIEKVSITGDSTTRQSIVMPHTDYVVVEGKQLSKEIEEGDE